MDAETFKQQYAAHLRKVFSLIDTDPAEALAMCTRQRAAVNKVLAEKGEEPASDTAVLAGIHKARIRLGYDPVNAGLAGVTYDMRLRSVEWLLTRGFALQ